MNIILQGIVGYSRKQQGKPHFDEISKNITDDDRTQGDMAYILHGKMESSKNTVALNIGNIINKMGIFMQFKSKTPVKHSRDPINLILRMLQSG